MDSNVNIFKFEITKHYDVNNQKRYSNENELLEEFVAKYLLKKVFKLINIFMYTTNVVFQKELEPDFNLDKSCITKSLSLIFILKI